MVKNGDECTLVTDPIQFSGLNASYSIRIGGEAKEVNVDLDKFKAESDHSGEETTEATVSTEEEMTSMQDYNTSAHVLPLRQEILDMDEGKIVDLVRANGGKVSHNVYEYDQVADGIDNSAEKSDNSVLYAIIAVFASLLVICLIIRHVR